MPKIQSPLCRNYTVIYYRCIVPLAQPEVPGMPTKYNCENNHPTAKCASCRENHPASSKECSRYKEQEIITLKYALNVPFPEARKIIHDMT